MGNSPVKHLKLLQGLNVWSINLAANMLTIQLGEKTKVFLEVLEVQRILGRFGLHVQSRWFLFKDDVLVLSRDSLDKDWNKNFADIGKISRYLSKRKPICVLEKYASGNFEMTFGKYELTVADIPDKKSESWRILDNVSRVHHVY
jgi:hypothetical protein